MIALLFAGVGIWLGLKVTKKEEVLVVKEVLAPAAQPFALNQERLKHLGITKRELEILELDRSGSEQPRNRGKTLRYENTVKTHPSRLFISSAPSAARRRCGSVRSWG